MIMQYKGYLGKIVYDNEARIFHGEIINAKSIITFQGQSVNELEKAIKDSVEDYLEWCKETSQEPDKPYSGNFKLRMPPLLHAKLSTEASLNNQSLNSLIIEKLSSN